MKNSIKGLAGIATLLNRADLPTHMPPADTKRRTTADIAIRTEEKIFAALPLGANLDPKHKKLISSFIDAGIRAAHGLGHAEALEQNSMVEKLLDKQYQTRTQVTTPAVVCAVMEQTGLSSMTLDLAMMATVFDRQEINYTVADNDVIEFTVRPVGSADDFHSVPLAEPFDETRADLEAPEQDVHGGPDWALAPNFDDDHEAST